MILFTGGKYQGKLDCALKITGLTEDEVLDFLKTDLCEEEFCDKNFGQKKVWYHLEEAVRYLSKEGESMESIIKKIKALYEKYSPLVIIISQVGAGVIPMDTKENIFREASGNLSIYFAGEATDVYRIVCGLEMKIK